MSVMEAWAEIVPFVATTPTVRKLAPVYVPHTARHGSVDLADNAK